LFEIDLKKNISNNLVLLGDSIFPYNRAIKTYKRHSVVLAVGGNVGNCRMRFKKLIRKIKDSKKMVITKISPILVNPPVGYLLQPDFLNFVLVARTDLTPEKLLNYTQYLEKRFKRQRVLKDGPRTLDIDIILFDSIEKKDKILHIPHPRWKERVFVVLPINLLEGNI
jgi:2-amino-4-hydroxy-6-hydroxymethyldihydropteridine diphosphokinase